MHILYLDTLALHQDSSLVELEHPAFQFWITVTEMKDLETSKDHRANDARKRVADAITARRLHYNPVDLSESLQPFGIYAPYANLLAHARLDSERTEGDDVWVVTEDPIMKSNAEKLQLRAVNTSEARKLFGEEMEREAQAAAEAGRLSREERKRQILMLVGGGILGIAAILAWQNLDPIIRLLSVRGAYIVLGLVGLTLYFVRLHLRPLYGFAELIVGYATARSGFNAQFDYTTVGPAQLVAILGGLYGVVQGLEDMNLTALLKGEWRNRVGSTAAR